MQEIKAENGGRPFANDDIMRLQTELTAAVQAQFLGKGPFILSGCKVSGPATGATITPGIVCLDGQLLRFYGRSGVQLPAQLVASPYVLSDPRTYQSGQTKNCAQEKPAVLMATDPAYTGGEFLPLDVWGGKTWAHVVASQVRAIGDVQYSTNVTLTDYDAGLGKPGTPAWGWGLCDGENGRANLLGQFVAGLDPSRAAYDTVGKTGGAETVTLITAQIPAHTHPGNIRITDGGSDATFSAALNSANAANGKTITSGSAGGGQSHENRPPFYVLAVRQWVGY
jgi:hypothetical protein